MTKKIKIEVSKFKPVPLVAWALMLFLVISLPPLLNLNNPMTIGILVWMQLVLSVSTWFMSALSRFVDEVNPNSK